ncbi:MAG TPA: hypothetical protein VFH35_10590 [Ramlibacter sp.]|nr:hypothetical protein [Ramlibacter sp.]
MTRRAIEWFDRLVWTLIYGGLLTLVVGIASGDTHRIAGWSLGVLGGAAAAAGFILIWVRSRLREDPAPSHQTPEGHA